MNEELLKKAKNVWSVEELLALAKKENTALTEEQAEEYFAKLQQAMGKLSDTELNAVSGGGCGGSSPSAPQSVTVRGRALDWNCPKCHKDCWDLVQFGTTVTQKLWYCCVCAETLGYENAPQVNQPGREWEFPTVYVTIE